MIAVKFKTGREPFQDRIEKGSKILSEKFNPLPTYVRVYAVWRIPHQIDANLPPPI